MLWIIVKLKFDNEIYNKQEEIEMVLADDLIN